MTTEVKLIIVKESKDSFRAFFAGNGAKMHSIPTRDFLQEIPDPMAMYFIEKVLKLKGPLYYAAFGIQPEDEKELLAETQCRAFFKIFKSHSSFPPVSYTKLLQEARFALDLMKISDEKRSLIADIWEVGNELTSAHASWKSLEVWKNISLEIE